MEQHPEKTFIGLVERGFDFLGVHFNRQGCRVSAPALSSFTARYTRLYERGASTRSIGGYVRRWIEWYKTVAINVLGIPPT